MKTIKLFSLVLLAFVFLGLGCKEDEAISEECNISCNQKPEHGLCQAAFTRFYFDKTEGKCKGFAWGGCGDVPFETLEECEACDCNN